MAVMAFAAAVAACSSDGDGLTGTGAAGAGAGGSGTGATGGSAGGGAPGSGGSTSSSASGGGGVIGGAPGCDPEDPTLTEAERALLELPADSWFAAPNTPFMAACDIPAHEPLHGNSGCGSVITAWSSAAWDADRSQLLLFGGGHDDYWGNEVYAFQPATMSWQIVKEASASITPDNQNQDPLDDGTPVSRHTYDGLQYLTGPHRFLSFGGAMARNGFSTTVTWTLDLDSGTWTNMQPGGEGTPFNGANGTYWMGTAYDPVSEQLFYKSEAGFSIYDVAGNAWSRVLDGGYPPLYPQWSASSYRRGVIDPKRRLFFAFGEDPEVQVFVWSIDDQEAVSEQWLSTGGDALLSYGAAGVDYDPTADTMVAWAGGAPWVMDMTTKVWTDKNGEGAPAEQVNQGTYGRWRYVPRYNVFILVNAPDEDVRFYKHTAGCGR
jgi:hypothetical protein